MKNIISLVLLCGFNLQIGAQVSFTLSSSPNVGSEPVYAAAADVNGDGKVDLIAASSGNDTLCVLTNDGRGGFVLSSSPPAGPYINTVLAVDMNGDSNVDLVTADYYANVIMVLTNDGRGDFTLSSSPGTGQYPVGLAAADVNGDGKVDLISGNSSQTDSSLSILTNNGSGGFTLSGKYAVGVNPWSVCAADVNGDGKLDLITANYGDSTLSVLTNNGSGGFAASGTYAVGNNPHDAIATDVNGDGKLDLVCANYNGNTISVLTNNGAGGFVASGVYPVGGNPAFVAAADVNGDGATDLIVANYGSSTLTVLTNNGSGGFGTAGTFAVGSNPRAVIAADINGDGKVDLISANFGAGTISILTNGTPFPPPSAPVITTQPIGQTNLVGSKATFSVGAKTTGWSPPLVYQWQFEGTNLPAATNSILTLTNLSLSQAGSYDVVVTNSGGSITSSPALLDVRFIIVSVNGQIATGTATVVAPAVVSLSGGYPGGFLFYTLDGSTPSTSSTFYSGPFSLTNSALVRVFSVNANFSQQSEGIPVTVQVIPSYSLQTSVIGNGSLSTNPPSGPYGSNSVVTLTANAAAYWSFAGWTGDATGSQNPLSITMNGPRNIQAVFVQSSFPLTLTTPGGGSITANGKVIAASTYYATNTVVSLAAGANSGWGFLGWQGSVSSTGNPLNLIINQTNNIQAIFGTFATTNSVGGGIVMSQSNPIPYGTILAVSAVPNPGDYFVNWIGSLSGTNSPAGITVTDASPSFGALFAPLPSGKYSLSVIVNGNGFVTNNPLRSYYNPGDMVTLTAVTNPGVYFFGWTQDATGTNNPLTIQMTTNKVIYANFGVVPTVGISPLNLTVLAGSNAVVSANALGVPPLAYQWQNAQGAIAGGTNATLVLSNAQPGNAGGYSVVVSNASGSVTSAVATVTVVGLPFITNQPASATVMVGHAAGFAVGAGGWPALAYQWQFNGINITGATNAAMALVNAFAANGGNYVVTVTNVYGSVTSSPAWLTVLPLDIATPARLANGQFQFTFDTAEGLNYEVEYSTNMLDWYPWLTLGGVGQPLTLIGPDTSGSQQRFYRIMLSPQ